MDSAIATAATIALYNRRLTREPNSIETTADRAITNNNGQQLLISRVTMNNESMVFFRFF